MGLKKVNHMIILAVTGHRPDHLWGYDLSHPNYKKLYNELFNFLVRNKPNECITGMALGVDTIFANAVLRYNEKNPLSLIWLECAIPCKDQEKTWPEKDQKLYHKILKKADTVTQVSKQPYSPELMQKRNEYMVDKCDTLLAVWRKDLWLGGTYNCVKYALKMEKQIINIDPNIFEKE
jgi:uncharacterized phage-like protein YoqJ